MAVREFEITIDPAGFVEVHVKGYKGRTCMEVAKVFEQIVGEMRSHQLTSEFYEPEEQVQFRIDQKT